MSAPSYDRGPVASPLLEITIGEALEAAAEFGTRHVPTARGHAGQGGDVAIVLPAASYDHADWRRAAARDLARDCAPQRVNIVAGDDGAAVASALAYLENAPGVTGQYLPLAGAGRFDG